MMTPSGVGLPVLQSGRCNEGLVDSHWVNCVKDLDGASAGTNYRFSSLILGLVRSSSFQMRIKNQEAGNPAVQSAAVVGR